MKTQISIQVKNESMFTRSLFWKAKVKVYIDSKNVKPLELKARKEPYVIDMEPGQHLLMFEAKARTFGVKLMAGVFGAALGAGAGMNAAIDFAEDAVDIASSLYKVQHNQLQCTLQEGDMLKIRIQPKQNGGVKIKIL